MNRKIFLALSLAFSTLCMNCDGQYSGSSDPFYRYSNSENQYGSVKTVFVDENASNPSLEDDTGTYTGTSIPPGINDGYNSTPSGRYKKSGGSYSNVLNNSK